MAEKLKLLLTGGAGTGKTTTAARSMPRPLVLDAERGATHYRWIEAECGGKVEQVYSVEDVFDAVRWAMQDKGHEFQTIILDPITPLFAESLDEAEGQVGQEFGRHYGVANKVYARLMRLLLSPQCDLNLVVTAHEKPTYNKQMEITGYTFDGYKKLDYVFDLWLRLERRPSGARFGHVMKTRLEEFRDQELFEWTPTTLAERWGKKLLEEQAERIELVSEDMARELDMLMRSASEKAQKALSKRLKGYPSLEDLPADLAEKCVSWLREQLKG